jgi:hypothetical protein
MMIQTALYLAVVTGIHPGNQTEVVDQICSSQQKQAVYTFVEASLA